MLREFTVNAVVVSTALRLDTFVVFDARVVSRAERAETQAENVAIVGAVTYKERAVRLVCQLRLRLVEPQRTPVPPTLSHTHTHTRLNITTAQHTAASHDIHSIERVAQR